MDDFDAGASIVAEMAAAMARMKARSAEHRASGADRQGNRTTRRHALIRDTFAGLPRNWSSAQRAAATVLVMRAWHYPLGAAAVLKIVRRQGGAETD